MVVHSIDVQHQPQNFIVTGLKGVQLENFFIIFTSRPLTLSVICSTGFTSNPTQEDAVISRV